MLVDSAVATVDSAVDNTALPRELHPRIYVRGELPIGSKHDVAGSEGERERGDVDPEARVDGERDLRCIGVDESRDELPATGEGLEEEIVRQAIGMRTKLVERAQCIDGARGQWAGAGVVEVDGLAARRPRKLALADFIDVVRQGVRMWAKVGRCRAARRAPIVDRARRATRHQAN